MAIEKAEEGKGLTPSQRNAELIIARLTDYLSIRFDHAGRINPRLKLIKQDLIYHELSNVRRCLYGDKIYGPTRQMVGDVFLGDDEKRRRNLMSATDQTSIQVELVSHCQDERVESTRGQIKIHDLKTFYASIDSGLADFLDLIETWIWWDILDAAEIVRFEQKVGKIAIIRQGRMTEEMRRRYTMLIHPPNDTEQQPKPVTDEEVILYEIQQMQYIRDQWDYRREGERGYKYVLKRDELPHANQGEMIHKVAEKVREYDAIESLAEITDDDRHLYAGDLKVAPAKVTREMVLAHLQDQLIVLEREMLQEADREAQLGPPYNYKERQLEQMDKWLTDLKSQLKIAPSPMETQVVMPPGMKATGGAEPPGNGGVAAVTQAVTAAAAAQGEPTLKT